MSHDRQAGSAPPWSIEIAPLMPRLLDDLARLVAITSVSSPGFSATGMVFLGAAVGSMASAQASSSGFGSSDRGVRLSRQMLHQSAIRSWDRP